MQNSKYYHSQLYADFAETPELAKFRRYLPVWSWILVGQISNIDELIKECNNLIADMKGVERTSSVFYLTDFPRACIGVEHSDLRRKMEELEALVRKYSMFHLPPYLPLDMCHLLMWLCAGTDLRTVHGLANMPGQRKLFSRHFAKIIQLFGGSGGIYEASIYTQVPSHPDTCSLKDFEGQDHTTEFALEHLAVANEWFNKSLNWILRKSEDEELQPKQYVELDTIRMIMNLLAALYAPTFFAVSLGVLSCVESEKMRIVALGGFGLLLTISLMLTVPTLKRSDLFSISAGYFAVGGVYIGAKSLDYRSMVN